MAKGPSAADSANELYIVKFRLGTGQDLKNRKERGQRVEILTYRLKKEVRRKILATRMRFRHRMLRHALSFYGLQVIRATEAASASEIAKNATTDLQKIDAGLEVRLVLIPLSAEKKRHPEIYDALVGAIKERLFTELIERIDKLVAKGETIPEVSRKAMLKLCDRLKTWNVVDDPDVNTTLDNYARLLDSGALEPLQRSLRLELDALHEEGAFLEL